MRTLLGMSLWQIRNAARASLRRPVVWIPILLGVLLAFANAHGLLFPQSPFPSDAAPFLRQHLEIIRAIVFLILTLLALGYIDSGLTGGALKFTPPDVALLFPAPFSRRTVLLFKLPAALSQHLLAIALIAGLFRTFVWMPGHVQSGGWSALLAAVFCVGGYLNLSLLLDMFSGQGRSAWIAKSFRLAALAAIAGLAWFLYRHGIKGLLALGHSGFLALVFSPVGYRQTR